MPRKGESKLFTPEMKDYIESIYKGRGRKEVIQMLNDKFGTNISVTQLGSLMQKNNWRSDFNATRFKKGNPSPFKGKRWDDWMSKEAQERLRKSGNLYHSKFLKEGEYHPIGATIFKHDVVMYKDVDNKWKRLAVKVWEDAYGKIPDGYVVLHIDKNKENNDLSNLTIVSKRELSVINKNKLVDDREINNLIIAKSRLHLMVKDRLNDKRRNNKENSRD